MTPDPEYGLYPLREVERAYIEHAMAKTGRKRDLTASLLQIGRTTLYRKLREYRAADRAKPFGTASTK